MKVNNVNVYIQQSNYNKSVVQPDGITHKIDTSKQYPLYMLEISKVYFDNK